MTELEIRAYKESDQDAVVDLWRACGLVVPWNDPVKDIHRKLLTQRDMFLVGSLDTRLVAAVMAGYEGHRGWINYLAVAPDCRKGGYGASPDGGGRGALESAGLPKINLQVRSSNADVIEFYQRIGYSTDDVISMGKRLEED